MANIHDIVAYCNQRLDVESINDYCPNGLQVEGRAAVGRIVSAVTASLETIEAAVEAGADMLLVHHGYFWKGESQPLTGMKGRRIRRLIQNDINLVAYHLPLDRHLELGNNAQLGTRLGLKGQPMDEIDPLLWKAELEVPVTGDTLSDWIREALGREPLLIAGKEQLRKIAWCTGGAQSYIEKAADAGCDAFISGEVSEQTTHIAREREITYVSAGHHATERYGVQALGAELAAQFSIEHHFVDLDNPV